MSEQQIRRLILIAAILMAVIIIILAVTALVSPRGKSASVRCVDKVLEDVNGNKRFDPGEGSIDLPLKIQVDDPDGPNTGLVSEKDCVLSAGSRRNVHLHFILPSEYIAVALFNMGRSVPSATDIDVTVPDSAHFTDNPPQIILLVRQAAATP